MKYISFILLFTFFSLRTNAQETYFSTYIELENMLENKEKANFKKAVFLTENVFLEIQSDTVGFYSEIEFLKYLCRGFMLNNPLNIKDYPQKDREKIAKYGAVFKVLTDTIKIQMPNGKIANHPPFGYDFEDFFGDQDWTKGFVTKLLSTRKGNCHSLPYLYKILCDELGAEAHLALAPNHLYIKHQSKKTGWYNTELTSATFPIDAWLMASGYITLEAIQNAVYMDSIGTHRAIALCVVDLGQGYAKKHPDNDGTFILQCCELALKHFPTCINAKLLKAETLFSQYKKILTDKGKEAPETQAKFAEMNQAYQTIQQTGYRQMPKQMYLNWLVDLRDNKGKYLNKKAAVFENKKRRKNTQKPRH